MNNYIKKIFGVDKVLSELEDSIEKKLRLEKELEEANKKLEEAKEKERLAQLSPKELATEKKEPWVAVLQTHVNKENIRNGFFELDWNEYFVLKLREEGYQGRTDEEIVDRWFSELCQNLGKETGVNMTNRDSGYLNFKKVD
jgi:hypothetical protein